MFLGTPFIQPQHLTGRRRRTREPHPGLGLAVRGLSLLVGAEKHTHRTQNPRVTGLQGRCSAVPLSQISWPSS